MENIMDKIEKPENEAVKPAELQSEGEIEDESAETAAGGLPIYQRPAPPQPGLP